MPLLAADVEDQVAVVVDADAEAATESNDGGNVIEAIVVVVVAVTVFDEEALRTQLSKLDTKVSSAAEPTLPVEGDAALYRVAEVICFPMSMGSGDAADDGNGLPAMLVTADEFNDALTCCCCWRNLRAVGRDATTRYRVRPDRSDSSLTAILSVSSGRSRLNMDCRCCWMSLPPDVDEAVEEEDAVDDEAIESRSSALSERERREAAGGGAGSSGTASVPPRSGSSFEPSIRAVPLPAK